MHAVEAKQLARMDGTALKAFFALLGSGPDGLSSEQVAEAMDYSIRPVQQALSDLVKLGMAAIQRQGRLVRYVACAAVSMTAATTPANAGLEGTGNGPEGHADKCYVKWHRDGHKRASHGKNSENEGGSGESEPPRQSVPAKSRQTAPSLSTFSSGAGISANRGQIGSMNTPNDTRQNPRPTPQPSRTHAPNSARNVADGREIQRTTTEPARKSAPFGGSALNSAPIPSFSPAPPLPKDTKTSPQQQHSESGRPQREVVVVGDFSKDLEKPGYLLALKRAIGSKRMQASERDFENAVRRHGLDYCEKQYATLMNTYGNADLISGRRWLDAIKSDYYGSAVANAERAKQIGKAIDAKTQQQQTAIRRAIAANDKANEAQANQERDEFRATLQRMSEDQLAALLDEVGSIPHHRPRNAISQARREGVRPIDVLTRPTIAPFTRDVLAQRASNAKHSAA